MIVCTFIYCMSNPEESVATSAGDGEDDCGVKIDGPFLTGVEIDVDQWRAQTIEELQNWLDDIRNRKTELGDPLVEFPEGWDSESIVSQKQQLEIISKGLAASLTGQEAREAKAEIQAIRAQAEKIRQLDKALAQLGDDDDDEPVEESPETEDFLNTEIVIPKIDTSGPNPFELTDDLKARLAAIDEKLGTMSEPSDAQPTKTLDQINDELLKLYQSPQTTAPPEEPVQPRPTGAARSTRK